MPYQRGDVLLVPFPFSDLSASKVRPAIVISSAAYHASEPDLILAAITSQVVKGTGRFDYVLADWQAAGLRYPSALKPILFTLDPTRVIYRVGQLSEKDFGQAQERLKQALGFDQKTAEPTKGE